MKQWRNRTTAYECIVDGFARKRHMAQYKQQARQSLVVLAYEEVCVWKSRPDCFQGPYALQALAASCCLALLRAQDGRSQTGSGCDVSDVSGGCCR